MYNLTQNESRVINFLIRNFRERNSINEIGRRLNLSPRGIYKLLKRLEKINAIKPEKIGNAIYYKISLDEQIGIKLAELVLIQNDLSPYEKIQAEDLQKLKNITLSCILFGSLLKKGKEARDIDVLLVLEKNNFNLVYKKLEEIKIINPKKIHEVLQTKEDLVKNIRKSDKVILEIVKEGKVLWGSEIIVETIRNGTS